MKLRIPELFIFTLLSTLIISLLIKHIPLSEAASRSSEEGTVLVVDNINIPGHARSALADMFNARIALFDGYTDAAMDMIKRAKETFNKDISKFAIQLGNSSSYGIPVDISVTFAEDFEPTKNDMKVISEAGELAKKGDTSAAYKKMLVEGIDLSFKFQFLPVASTVKKLDKVYSDLKAGSYYKANLDLKAIQDSVVVENFGAYDTPKQGFSWEMISKK